MAAYHRVDDIVTCGLTACTPGSAPGPTLGNEYGKPLSCLTKEMLERECGKRRLSRQLNKQDAMDYGKWRKLIKDIE